jgi:HD-GYP domain-containing protein (c-di-GMP phosphodiesterase class II)
MRSRPEGIHDYLTKPFDLREVLARLSQSLQRCAAARAGGRREQQLTDSARRSSRATARLLLGAIESLSSALEAKDGYTRGHSERVSRLAGLLARALGEAPERVRRLRLAGKLHDIGKIGVREAVLGKPGPLTAEEWEQVEAHPVVGERILSPLLEQAEIGAMVRGHHERYGGGGYPDGLRGSSIPLGSRVLAVADAFDALTSDRPYRARLPVERALEVLWQGAGSQWQPTLVEALQAHLRAGTRLASANSDRCQGLPVEANEGGTCGPSRA